MKTYNIELSEHELYVIGQLLNEAPHKVSRPIIDNIERQISEGDAKAGETE